MSTQNSKKGFTLIELMVVIVIIGILAAIAIPKLFGMTAKAKASEVGPAAGTWSKLQQAFAMEIPKAGSFKQIGYTAPGDTTSAKISNTNNFKYTDPSTADTAATMTWKAENIQKLNDCGISTQNTWETVYTAAEMKVTSAKVAGTELITQNGTNIASGDCGSLTPNFGFLK
jgi:prepilin-type N-terminal cleavage/methylation domain-containing protein